MSNTIAGALNLDPRQSAEVGETLVADAFFSKLAEFGVVPQSDDEIHKLWAIGERLQTHTKEAAAQNRASVLDFAYGLVSKTASTSQQPAAAELGAEVKSKVAAYLNNPELFGHGLVLLQNQSN